MNAAEIREKAKAYMETTREENTFVAQVPEWGEDCQVFFRLPLTLEEEQFLNKEMEKTDYGSYDFRNIVKNLAEDANGEKIFLKDDSCDQILTRAFCNRIVTESNVMDALAKMREKEENDLMEILKVSNPAMHKRILEAKEKAQKKLEEALANAESKKV